MQFKKQDIEQREVIKFSREIDTLEEQKCASSDYVAAVKCCYVFNLTVVTLSHRI